MFNQTSCIIIDVLDHVVEKVVGRGKVNEFELELNWEEGKLMMNTLNFWVLVKVFKVDKP